MASEVFEKFIKKASPNLRAEIAKAGQELDQKGAQEKPLNYDPQLLDQQSELSRPHAAEPKQILRPEEAQTTRTPNAMDRTLASGTKTQAAEQGQALKKQNVKEEKEPER